MATLLSNNNSYVRWDKSECHNYTITNLLSYADVEVTVTSETGDYEETFTLLPETSNSIDVECDGVYKICVTPSSEAFQDELVVNPNTNLANSTTNIGQMRGQDEAVIERISVVGVGDIYLSGTLPYPPNSWAGVPLTYSAMVTEINNWLAANGGGYFDVIPPGVADPNFPWIPVDNLNYQLGFYSEAGYELELVETTQWNASSVPTGYLHIPVTECIVSWDFDLSALDPQRDYVVSFIIGGVNILQDPVFVGDQAGIDNFFSIVQTWLNENGGGSVFDQNNFVFVFENCDTPGDLTLANILTSGQECDYFYEFCDMYACVTRLVTQWLCNKCPEPCDPEFIEAQEARERAIELSTLFFHALMPLVSQDRLWHLGNWDVNEERLCNINNIKDLYTHIKEFLCHCGFTCHDPCEPCGGSKYPCGPCDETTTKSNCGCK